MAGLNGVVSIKKEETLYERITKMNNVLAHRGPEASVTEVVDERVAFGHRQQSVIQSPNTIGQPNFINQEDWLVTFDGEIYNFQLLRDAIGDKLKKLDDNEVLLRFINQYGIEHFLKQANGVFAIALHNYKESKTYLMRDRLGVKPLYYSIVNNEKLIFSSEIKGILSSGLVQPEFYEDAIDEYLANRFIRAPFTFFKNINQVEPATMLIFDSDLKNKKRQYWTLPSTFNFDNQFDESEITEEFHQQLSEAVQKRVVTDFPIGAYLSGGVDSSLLTAMATKMLNKSIPTYTIGFSELNEFKYSEIVSRQYNTKHHQLNMNMDDYFVLMESVIASKDAPLGVPNEIPLAVMSKEMKKEILVVLSGEGADELLGGYGRIFRLAFEYEKNKYPSQKFYDNFIDEYEYVPRAIRDEFILTEKSLREHFDQKINSEFEKYPNEENIFRYFHNYHVKGLLERVDATTSSDNIIARTPFLDHELIEYAYQYIPYELKLKWKNKEAKKNAYTKTPAEFSEVLDTPKYILKKVGESYLPDEVLYRTKMGFPVPLNDWLTTLESKALDLLKDAYWIKEGTIERLLVESKKNARAGQLIWMFINIEVFRKQYFEKKWTW